MVLCDAKIGNDAEASPGTVNDAHAEVWALVERTQKGEMDAFGMIYRRYFDTVFRFIYFRVGKRHLAEDLSSETFVRALKRINSFTYQGRDLGAWLVTIARNLVADYYKSGWYRLEVSTRDIFDEDFSKLVCRGPESEVLNSITHAALRDALALLTEEQQECLVLRFLMDLSVSEVAQAMDKSIGAIKALQFRATRSLARMLPDGSREW